MEINQTNYSSQNNLLHSKIIQKISQKIQIFAKVPFSDNEENSKTEKRKMQITLNQMRIQPMDIP